MYHKPGEDATGYQTGLFTRILYHNIRQWMLLLVFPMHKWTIYHVTNDTISTNNVLVEGLFPPMHAKLAPYTAFVKYHVGKWTTQMWIFWYKNRIVNIQNQEKYRHLPCVINVTKREDLYHSVYTANVKLSRSRNVHTYMYDVGIEMTRT
jgi:hypothetical protein